MMRPVGDWGAGWGRSLMALFGLPKRAIKLRPQLAPQKEPLNSVPNWHSC